MNIALRSEPAESKTETASLIGDAFARLPEEQRTLIWLREVEGHSYAELAEILEIPVGTVRSRLFAAREELRRVWHAAREVKKGGT
jgi:RNA polymerase sigma-70 factor, ECF subfamily